MLMKQLRFVAVLAFYFCVNFALASPRAGHNHRRDGPTTSATIIDATTAQTSDPTQSSGISDGDVSSSIISSSGSEPSSFQSSPSETGSSSATATSAPVISAVTSNINGINGAAPTSIITTSVFNATATPGKLPLTPEVSPAYGVAGVILMITGIVYTLVGIKNKHLHICLSAAYLAGLAVTVLILYVMNPPVSNAIQGAYLVAVVLTGMALGGAAIVFSELTEGLGCLLGGFCLSMWLLVLKPGGLLTSTGAKAAFIAAFTLAAFATSFSHITRPYALIGFISFSGATAVVIGIDCVSKAGLKEFWAYLWDLNDNLFPVGVTTYPITRGMKVEIAAIVVIFLAGLMSQMKLWKVIKERREQRAAQRLEDERTIQKEEEHLGKRIEEHNAQERNQWEAVYGNKEVFGIQLSRDSGVADVDSQKKGPTSTVTSCRRSGEKEIEMAELPCATLENGAGLARGDKGQDVGSIIVRVAQDPEYPTVTDENGNSVEHPEKRSSHLSSHSSPLNTPEEEDVWVMGADGEAHLERRPSQQGSRRTSKRKSAGPVVVPLPFKVPDDEIEGEIEGENSSVATFADDEVAVGKRKSKRHSAGSAILKRLSRNSNRNSKRFSIGAGSSTEDLVIPRAVDERPMSRASSLEATMDGMSEDEDMRSTRSSVVHVKDSNSPNLDNTASVVDPAPSTLPEDPTKEINNGLSAVSMNTSIMVSSESCSKEPETPVQEYPLLTSNKEPNENAENVVITPARLQDSEVESKEASSITPAAESKPAVLSKESLPPRLSRVVMSYRTNEWAKHLSTADAPHLEELQLSDYPAEAEEQKVEVAAPVNVEELQQTAESSPAPSRSASQLSHRLAPSRSASSLSRTHPSRPEIITGESLTRSSSQTSFHPQQLPNRTIYRSPSTPMIQPIVESPTEDQTSFPSSRNAYGNQATLIGQRDTILRNKSSLYIPTPLNTTPEFSPSQSHIPSTNPSITGSDDLPEDDTMPLSQRRDLIRQQSLSHYQQPSQPYPPNQPHRSSTLPHPLAREQQLASFRASVQNEFVSAVKPRATIERQRSQLWMEKQAEEQKRDMQGRMREARDRGFDERMRRGDMLEAHREALRKMQARANGNA